MFSHNVCRAVASFCLLGLFLGSVQAQDLILTSPPRETAAEGDKLYGPLAAHLTALLGVKVVYEHPTDWLAFQRDMRNDKYDVVFDGPHFVSWRMVHLGHEVLVKMPGTLEFFLARYKKDPVVKDIDDLVGKKICGISPPNLSSLVILDRFRNPVRQPVLIGVKGGAEEVYTAFKAGKCEAAVYRNTFFTKKLTDAQRAELDIIFRSKVLPDQAISVSRRLNPREKAKIVDSLTMGNGVEVMKPIVQRFGPKGATSFLPAKASEYEGLNELLEGVIFGW